MANTIYKWRLWCTTDNAWFEVWSPTEPTNCPDNSAHSIDTTKTSILDKISEDFPLSDVGDKIAVHSSPKPAELGKTVYVVWTGSGDDLTTDPHTLGNGELLQFQMTPGTALVTKDLKFSPSFGNAWIHEAYLSYETAGFGDYITAFVVAPASPLQTVANLMLYLDGTWVKAVPTDGSITPTHGFAGTPSLLPRTFSHDGNWDWDGTTLSPNYTNTGGYKISHEEKYIHRFVNKIPLHGTNPYFTLTSDESSLLPPGYFLRIEAHNVSNTIWNASVFLEIYREMTNKP